MTKHSLIFTERKTNPSYLTQKVLTFQQGQKISSVPASLNLHINVIKKKYINLACETDITTRTFKNSQYHILYGSRKKKKRKYYVSGNMKWLEVYYTILEC